MKQNRRRGKTWEWQSRQRYLAFNQKDCFLSDSGSHGFNPIVPFSVTLATKVSYTDSTSSPLQSQEHAPVECDEKVC